MKVHFSSPTATSRAITEGLSVSKNLHFQDAITSTKLEENSETQKTGLFSYISDCFISFWAFLKRAFCCCYINQSTIESTTSKIEEISSEEEEKDDELLNQWRRKEYPLHGIQDFEIAKKLVKECDLKKTDQEGNTPMHLVTSPEMAKLFLENGADIDTLNKQQETPFIKTFVRIRDTKGADQSAIDIALALLSYGANPKTTLNNLQNQSIPLILIAIYLRLQPLIEKMLEQQPELANEEDADGISSLQWAITLAHTDKLHEKQYLEVAKILISHEANTNKKVDGKMPLLILMAQYGQTELIKFVSKESTKYQTM